MTNISPEDSEELEEYAYCDGCGIQDTTVYDDGYGFNICGHGCTAYSVRGFSPSDFL